MGDLVLVVLMALAAYRLYRLFSIDEFPPIADTRRWIHARLKRRFGEEWAHGMKCPWCAGFWWSIAVVLAVNAVTSIRLPVLTVLAVSCLVGLIGLLDE